MLKFREKSIGYYDAIEVTSDVTAIVRSNECNESFVFYLTKSGLEYLHYSSANPYDVEAACVEAGLPDNFVYGSTNSTGEAYVVGEIDTKEMGNFVVGICVMEVNKNGKKELKLAHARISTAGKKKKNEEQQGFSQEF